MNRKVSEIFGDWREQGVLTQHQGPDTTITGIAAVESFGANDLVFVDKPSFTQMIAQSTPA